MNNMVNYFVNDLMERISARTIDPYLISCFENVQISDLNEKIQLIYRSLKLAEHWSHWSLNEQQSSKATTKAILLRVLGNSSFQSKEYGNALKYYTESVAVAPVGSQELAFAYANRSAVLFRVEKYVECLMDINRAFQENYPEAKKQKLVDRKNKCFVFLQDITDRYRLWPNIVQSLSTIKDMDQLSEGYSAEMTDLPPQSPLPEVIFENKLIPIASNKIKMENTQDNVIGIVATANIKPGEIIAIEKPVAWFLAMQNHHLYCANCFVRFDSLIPCPKCSVVLYCSTRCRDNAFGLFHRIECQIFCKFLLEDLKKLLANWNSWTVVRVLLVVTKQGEELDQIMNHPAYKLPLSESFSHNVKEVFNSQDFSSVLSHGKSTSDKNFKDLSAEHEFSSFRTVLTWLYHLKQSTFFGHQKRRKENFNTPLTNRELYVVTLLLKLSETTLQPLRVKVKETSDLENKTTTHYLGDGLFPLMNVFRHSCEPHAVLYCSENYLVCRSIRPIKAGEEIFICYFCPYYRGPKSERIEQLQFKFKFECTCKACEEDWPTEDKLPVGSPKVLANNFGAKKFQKYRLRFQKLRDSNLDELPSPETIEFLSEYSSLLDSRFEKPCQEIVECECLLDLSLSLCGNFYGRALVV